MTYAAPGCSHPLSRSSLFALSIGNHLVGGYLWVIVMCSLGILSNFITYRIAPARRRAHAH